MQDSEKIVLDGRQNGPTDRRGGEREREVSTERKGTLSDLKPLQLGLFDSDRREREIERERER